MHAGSGQQLELVLGMERGVVVADQKRVLLAIGRDRHRESDDQRLGEEDHLGSALERRRRIERVEEDRVAVELDADRRDPPPLQPARQLGIGDGRVAALIELVLERAVRLDPAEQAEPDRERRRLDLDTRSLQHTIGRMGGNGRNAEQ